MLYVIIIQELTGYCWISHQLFSRTITNRAESLRNYFAQLTGWVVKIRNQPIQKRSCFWYRKLCAFNPLSWGLNVVLRYLTSSDFCVALILWARNVPESPRNRPDVGNIFMLRRYFVPLPWRFLTQPELQQGSDRLNCNQKHFFSVACYKINCIFINEQVASIFSCNLRSDSELERHFAQHFTSLPPGELCFWRYKVSGRWLEISGRRLD